MSYGSKLWDELLGEHLSKTIGALLSALLIFIGAFILSVDTVQNGKNDETLFKETIDEHGITRNKIHTSINDGFSKTIIKLQIALEEKTDELKRILSKMGEQNGKDKKDLLKYLEKALEEEDIINTLIKDVKSQFNLEKKIATAHVFFKHSLKLIFILSGIIGLFWIAIWIAREQREKREIEEQKRIRNWEIKKTALEAARYKKDSIKDVLERLGYKKQ